ncbi:hypothetical protein [Micromonospora orduensis]|uniref:hypothetical protein n=1 Tax=Micromonospora orduensis TaxID=1420891 RepID=UPI0033FCE358
MAAAAEMSTRPTGTIPEHGLHLLHAVEQVWRTFIGQRLIRRHRLPAPAAPVVT